MAKKLLVPFDSKGNLLPSYFNEEVLYYEDWQGHRLYPTRDYQAAPNGEYRWADAEATRKAIWQSETVTIPVTWKESFEFEATMELKGFGRTKQGHDLIFADEQGRLYSMFVSDFTEMVMRVGGLPNCRVTGKWTFLKRNTSYGLKFVG